MISQVLKILFLTYLIAALLKQFQPHTDTINSIQLFTRSERLLVLTASSDCAVALWDVEGRHIGIFGQVGLFLNPCFQAPQCNRDILTFVVLYDRFRRNNFDLQLCKGRFFSDTIFGHSIQKKKRRCSRESSSVSLSFRPSSLSASPFNASYRSQNCELRRLNKFSMNKTSFYL